jgi:hypothetical protein
VEEKGSIDREQRRANHADSAFQVIEPDTVFQVIEPDTAFQVIDPISVKPQDRRGRTTSSTPWSNGQSAQNCDRFAQNMMADRIGGSRQYLELHCL